MIIPVALPNLVRSILDSLRSAFFTPILALVFSSSYHCLLLHLWTNILCSFLLLLIPPLQVWDEHPHIELLAASTNFIISPSNDFDRQNETFLDILRALAGAGLNVPVRPEGPVESTSSSSSSSPVKKLITKHSASAPAPSPRALASALLESLDSQRQAIMSLIAALPAHAVAAAPAPSKAGPSSSLVGIKNAPLASAISVTFPEERRELYSPKMLCSRYLGTQFWKVYDNKIEGTDSFEFSLTVGSENSDGDCPVSGSIVWRRIYVRNLGGPMYAPYAAKIAEAIAKDLTGTGMLRALAHAYINA